MIEDILRDTIEKFNEKARTDEKLKAELKDLVRILQVRLEDGRSYNFTLKDGSVGKLEKGEVERPDIVIESSEEILTALYNREMRPMKALALRKIRIEASLDDMVRFRSFF